MWDLISWSWKRERDFKMDWRKRKKKAGFIRGSSWPKNPEANRTVTKITFSFKKGGEKPKALSTTRLNRVIFSFLTLFLPGDHLEFLGTKWRTKNRPKTVDQKAPTEISDESINSTQNYRLVRNFGRVPSDRVFWPIFGSPFCTQKIWGGHLAGKGLILREFVILEETRLKPRLESRWKPCKKPVFTGSWTRFELWFLQKSGIRAFF